MFAVVVCSAICTVAGIVTNPGAEEARFTVSPPTGAGPDRVTVRTLVSVPDSVSVCGDKLKDAVVKTVCVVEPYPGPLAVMLAEPGPTPVICGCAAGSVCPAAISTEAGVMLTLVGSLLVKATVTPPVGAGADKLIGNGTVCPRPTEMFEGRLIPPDTVTVTFAVAPVTPGVLVLAVMVAEPVEFPVIGTVTLVAGAVIVTDAGTLATAALLEDRLMISPPAGGAPVKVNVKFWVPPTPTLRLVGAKLMLAETWTV
jgi:hypothetical protein